MADHSTDRFLIIGKLEEPFSHLNRIREEERMQGR
jgi:hypothetical protein